MSLPDLDNGYSIHSADRVGHGLHPGPVGRDVIEVAHESVHMPVLQIGSDGGGGLYALERYRDDFAVDAVHHVWGWKALASVVADTLKNRS